MSALLVPNSALNMTAEAIDAKEVARAATSTLVEMMEMRDGRGFPRRYWLRVVSDRMPETVSTGGGERQVPTQREEAQAARPVEVARTLKDALGEMARNLLRMVRDPRTLREGRTEKWAGLEVLAVFPGATVRPEPKTKGKRTGGRPQTWRRRATAVAAHELALANRGSLTQGGRA